MRWFNKLIEKLYFSNQENAETFQEIYKLAYTDTLTGLYNRNFYNYDSKFTYAVPRCFVLFVDVDNLKQTNDTYGHPEGDRLIISVADQLKRLSHAQQIIRYAGDEMLVIFGEEYDYAEFSELEDCSWGFVEKGLNESLCSAVRRADDAMFIMKRSKKNRIGFNVG